jgi:hypothetical protein
VLIGFGRDREIDRTRQTRSRIRTAAAAQPNRRGGRHRRPINAAFGRSQSMIGKSLSSTPIGDGHPFSDKIMLNQN